MIDKQGRVFGKINIIDLVIVLMIGALVIIASIKIFNRGDWEKAPQVEEGKIIMTLEVSDATNTIENYISKGDKLLVFNAFSGLEIESFEFEPDVDTNGNVRKTKVRGIIKVQGKAKKDGKGVYLDNVYLRVNSGFDVVTNRIIISSRICDIEFNTNN